MRNLLKIVFLSKRHRFLIFLSIFSMICLTVASQLEVVAVGIITYKGPDFFELFAPINEGKLEKSDVVDVKRFSARWQDLDLDHKGFVTKEDARTFLGKYKQRDMIATVIKQVDRIVPLSTNMKAFAAFIVFVALFRAVTIFCSRYFAKLIAIRVSADLRLSYFEHLQLMPMKFYQKYNMGNLSSRAVSDATTIADALNAAMTNYLQTPFVVISTLSLCFYTSFTISLILFFGLPLIIFPIVYLARGVKRVARKIQRTQEIFTSVLIDFLAGIQTIKLFAMENFSLKKFQEQNKAIEKLEQKGALYDISARPIIHTLGMCFLATALIFGLYVLRMNLSDIFVYCGLLYIFYEPIKKFAEENARVQRGITAAERMIEVLQIKPEIEDVANAKTLQGFHQSIDFDNVWFKYDGEWVLKGVSFSVRKGEKVAIVGQTGSGKSTLVQLLPRLYDIQKGEIRIDGTSLSDFSRKSLVDNIACVPQKTFLFLDTVAANIAYGYPYTDEQIEQAAKAAYADEFIEKMPEKYHTLLLEMGKGLSGGQQQRLAIARALIKKAPILILDEATSSLDALSEKLIKQALEKLKSHITQIVIAHRFPTIEDADKIIVLDKGEKIAEGTKEELLQSCPLFQFLWNAQR